MKIHLFNVFFLLQLLYFLVLTGIDGATLIRKRRVVVKSNRLWQDGVIPYKISPKLKDKYRDLVKEAMKEWEKGTCIKFKKMTDSDDESYIYIRYRSGICQADVGRKPNKGNNTLMICGLCDYGIILHELGHVIGLHHEQIHPDRNKYIDIDEDNIETGAASNFERRSHDEVDTFDQPYNYNSIMHYGAYTFADNRNQRVITPRKDENGEIPKIGQREIISDGDRVQVNLAYKCNI